jgi:hypothetical protein
MKALLAQCQNEDPEKRPGSARELLEQLKPLWKDLQIYRRRA